MAVFLLHSFDSARAFLNRVDRSNATGRENYVVAYLCAEPRGDDSDRASAQRAKAIRGTLPSSFDVDDFLSIPLSNTRSLSWARLEGGTVICDSRDALRRVLKLDIDKARLTLSMCQGLPMGLYNQSMWSGNQTALPGSELRFDHSGDVSVRNYVPPAAIAADSIQELTAMLDQELMRAVERCVKGRISVSSDLSGGVDSTTIAYYLASLGCRARFFHSVSEDPRNNDLKYATRAASELNCQLEIIDSSTETRTSFLPWYAANPTAVGEGVPRWIGSDVHARNIVSSISSKPPRVHLTGLGGDELFDYHFAAPLDLLHSNDTVPSIHRKRAIRQMWRVFRSGRWGSFETMVAGLSRSDLKQELKSRIYDAHRYEGDRPVNHFGWCPGFRIPSYLSTDSREMLLALVDYSEIKPLHQDRFRHSMLDSLMKQGELIRHLNASFSPGEQIWSSPLLDPSLIECVLRFPTWAFVRDGPQFKNLLALATAKTVPRWVFERSDKGDMSLDLFADAKRNLPSMKRLLKNGALIDYGLVDPSKLARQIDAPIHSTSQLMELEDLANVEKWIRAVAA